MVNICRWAEEGQAVSRKNSRGWIFLHFTNKNSTTIKDEERGTPKRQEVYHSIFQNNNNNNNNNTHNDKCRPATTTNQSDRRDGNSLERGFGFAIS